MTRDYHRTRVAEPGCHTRGCDLAGTICYAIGAGNEGGGAACEGTLKTRLPSQGLVCYPTLEHSGTLNGEQIVGFCSFDLRTILGGVHCRRLPWGRRLLCSCR